MIVNRNPTVLRLRNYITKHNIEDCFKEFVLKNVYTCCNALICTESPWKFIIIHTGEDHRHCSVYVMKGSIWGSSSICRFTPRLAREAPHLTSKLGIILSAVMWIRKSCIGIVYPQKDLGALVFSLRINRLMWMELPCQVYVSPPYILYSRRRANLQYFIQVLWFHVTALLNDRLCDRAP